MGVLSLFIFLKLTYVTEQYVVAFSFQQC